MAWTETSVSAERVIAAPPEKIFNVIADPANHPVIDGSGTVKAASGPHQRLALGSKFRMRMQLGVPYLIRNRVIEFEEGRRIAWWHPAHNAWRYELIPEGESTKVVETFDWSKSRMGPFLGKFPERNLEGMQRTLERLDRFVTTGKAD